MFRHENFLSEQPILTKQQGDPRGLNSNFSINKAMDHLFREIEKSLSDGNFYAALFMILTVPDICLSVKMGKHCGADYEKWFDKNISADYNKFMSGKDCYAFRCAILHEGTDSVLKQSKKDIIDKFEILSKKESAHLIYMGGNTYNGVIQPTKLVLNLHAFCNDLINSAEKFIKENNLKVNNLIEIKERYSDGFISIS